MITLALLALVASVLVWASPGSQAQSNQAPQAVASVTEGNGVVSHLDGYLVNPDGPIGLSGVDGATLVGLSGASSIDNDDGTATADCNGCSYRWEILEGPYGWIGISGDTIVGDGTTTGDAATYFAVPSQAFVSTVSDSDPQKYEITAQLTVTDNRGATSTDTVTIYLNQRPTANISLFAGLRDQNVVADDDTGVRDLYSIPGVIDGPGENGNADNEWDVLGGAYVELTGFTSSDPDNVGGAVASYRWSLSSPSAAPSNINGTGAGGGTFRVGATAANPFSDVLPGTTTPVPLVGSPGPGARHTLFYQLAVCDRTADATADPTVCATANPTLASTSIIKIVVHDTSAAPDVATSAKLTDASEGRGDTAPQSTIGAITGVEDQFLVAAGSTVELKATVDNSFTRSTGTHTFQWTGASQTAVTQSDATTTPAPTLASSTATVRIPRDAEDGDTIDVSVKIINNTSRLSTTTPIQLLVATNRKPTAQGVPANSEVISVAALHELGIPPLHVHVITDGFQNPRDGSTVTLRGVATDGDGDPLITSWVLREAKSGQKTTITGGAQIDTDAALQAAIEGWLALPADTGGATAKATAAQGALGVFGSMLKEAQEPVDPLIELEGALTTTASFEVPNLRNHTYYPDPLPAGSPATAVVGARDRNNSKGTLMFFTVIDSNGAFSTQFIYLLIKADDDAPSADAGPDQQVEAGGFVRLNGAASSDPDVMDRLSYRWDYVGATMDPLPNQRPPLTDDEIKELTGWVLRPATAAEANEPGLVRDSSGNRYKYIVNSSGDIVDDADVEPGTAGFSPATGFASATAGGKLLGRTSAYPWFDAPDFSGFNDIKLHFRLNAKDSPGTVLNGDGNIANADIAAINEFHVGVDLNEDGAIPTTADVATNPASGLVSTVKEALLGLDLNNNGDALETVNLATTNAVEANVGAVDEDEVIVTVARRYFTGNVPSPDFCTNQSLGGPSTYPFDQDRDGVADVCSLNTTRRATVARQNALENLAGVFPTQFRFAVLAVCDDPVFKATDWQLLGDEADDLDNDACETTRVSPPPAPVDPAIADVFFSGVITSQDFCTNHSLGGARTYANDIDGDGVADQCSLSTTRREAVARQRALGTFNVSLSSTERTTLAELRLLTALEDKMTANNYANNASNNDVTVAAAGLTEAEQAEYARIFVKHVGRTGVTVVGFGATHRLTDPSVANSEETAVNTQLGALEAKYRLAVRYSNALLAECRALGTQDFGDAASALARDECNPRDPVETGLPES